jgi:hypothetical protein
MFLSILLYADLPQDVPSITTEKLRYSLDEPIAANCTSPYSFPAANITWFVNNVHVSIYKLIIIIKLSLA